MKLDSLASVRKGAEEFLRQSEQLNVLINNAGYARAKLASRLLVSSTAS